MGTLKSEVIFCVGFMSLALMNKSDEFRTYAKQFIEMIRTSPLMSSKEVQRKRLALTITTNNLNNLINDTKRESLTPAPPSSSGNVLSTTTNSSTMISSNSMNSLFTTVNSLSFAFSGNAQNVATAQQNNAAPTVSPVPLTNNASSSLSVLSQLQAAQINELNSIMACVAMFASSMVNFGFLLLSKCCRKIGLFNQLEVT